MIIDSRPCCRNRIPEQLSYDLAIAENPRNRGVSSGGRHKRGLVKHTHLWGPGRTLWISFMGSPDRSLKMAIFELASQWTDLSEANLELDLAEDNDAKAQIRVLTGKDVLHNQSDLGTDALAYTDETMCLNVAPGEEWFECTVLHEFGHALGLQHEHTHPDANIPWNEQALIATLQGAGWTAQDVHQQYLDVQADTAMIKTAYDPLSIMHYAVAQWQTIGDFEIARNHQLSEKDLELMRLAYPHD